MQKIKENDLVQVISGNDLGIRGTVEEVIHTWTIDQKTKKRLGRNPNGDCLRVEGVNVRKKHRRRTSPTSHGEIVEIRAPIHISNVMLVCPHCDEAVRVGFKKEGLRKVRYCKRCQANID